MVDCHLLINRLDCTTYMMCHHIAVSTLLNTKLTLNYTDSEDLDMKRNVKFSNIGAIAMLRD